MTKRLTLRKTDILRRRSDFAALFDQGKRVGEGSITLLYLVAPADATHPAGIIAAFVAPKRTFKQAVLRNRVKRRLREAYRNLKPNLLTWTNARNLCLLVCILHGRAQVLPFAELQQSVAKAFDKLMARHTPLPPVATP